MFSMPCLFVKGLVGHVALRGARGDQKVGRGVLVDAEPGKVHPSGQPQRSGGSGQKSWTKSEGILGCETRKCHSFNIKQTDLGTAK